MTNRCTVCGKVLEEDRTHICWTAINAASPPIVNGLPSPDRGSTGDLERRVAELERKLSALMARLERGEV